MYFHHNWPNWKNSLGKSFPNIKDHVLLNKADRLKEAAQVIKVSVTQDKVKEIVSLIPSEWLEDPYSALTISEKRAAYITFLCDKMSNLDLLVKEAEDAR